VSEVRRLRELEGENGKLKQRLAGGDVGHRGPEGSRAGKTVSPLARREAVQAMRAKTAISERRVCQLRAMSRTVLHSIAQLEVDGGQPRCRIVEQAAQRRLPGAFMHCCDVKASWPT
jgi:putative transposase